MPKVFHVKMMSGEGKDGTKVRKDCLDRLKLRSPPLSASRELRWAGVSDAYIRRLENVYKKGLVGPFLLARVKSCVAKLGCHWMGFAKDKVKPVAGDLAGFASYYKEMEDTVPKPATSVEL